MTAPDPLLHYDIERYLFDVVTQRFQAEGKLSAFDLFSIVIWKSNRTKTLIAGGLVERFPGGLEEASRAVTMEIHALPTARERLLYLVGIRGFGLAMASAVLTVMYPDDFTVYDWRVCSVLEDYEWLSSRSGERLWSGYCAFRADVQKTAPPGLSLRDKDRSLWGQSDASQLAEDIARAFSPRTPTP